MALRKPGLMPGDVTGDDIVDNSITGQQIDESSVMAEALGTIETNTDKVLKPDGLGGLLWDDAPSAVDVNAIHVNEDGEIYGITKKTVPVDADVLVMEDSEASFAKKRLSWLRIKEGIKAYTDTLYSETDEKVKASSTDATAGFLGDKVDGSTIDVSSQKLTVLDSPKLEGQNLAGVRAHAPSIHGDSHLPGGGDPVTHKEPICLLPVGGYPAIIGGNQSGFLRLFQSTVGISAIEDYNKVRMPKCKVLSICGRVIGEGSTLTLRVRLNGLDTSLVGTVSDPGVFKIIGDGPIDFNEANELSVSFSTSAGSGKSVAGLVVEYSQEVI